MRPFTQEEIRKGRANAELHTSVPWSRDAMTVRKAWGPLLWRLRLGKVFFWCGSKVLGIGGVRLHKILVEQEVSNEET